MIFKGDLTIGTVVVDSVLIKVFLGFLFIGVVITVCDVVTDLDFDGEGTGSFFFVLVIIVD
jgi:hypothetical protein